MVIFHSVCWPHHLDVLQAGDGPHHTFLKLFRKAIRDTVGINNIRVVAFGLEPDGVVVFVTETQDFGFKRRAIPRPFLRFLDVDTLVQVIFDELVCLQVGVSFEACDLVGCVVDLFIEETEGCRLDVAVLTFEADKVDGVSVEPRWSSGLQTSELEACLL